MEELIRSIVSDTATYRIVFVMIEKTLKKEQELDNSNSACFKKER